MIFICFQSLFKVSVRSDTFAQWLLLELWMITHKMFHAGTKHILATDGQLKFFLSLCGPYIYIDVSHSATKMYHRYSWHKKNTWSFLYLFLRLMICWNQIEQFCSPCTHLEPFSIYPFAFEVRLCCATPWILTGEIPMLLRVKLSFFFGDSSAKNHHLMLICYELSVSIILSCSHFQVV